MFKKILLTELLENTSSKSGIFVVSKPFVVLTDGGNKVKINKDDLFKIDSDGLYVWNFNLFDWQHLTVEYDNSILNNLKYLGKFDDDRKVLQQLYKNLENIKFSSKQRVINVLKKLLDYKTISIKVEV